MSKEHGQGRGRLFREEPGTEVRDELEFHIEQRAREYMAGGMDAESARRAALERIGDFDRVRGECTELLVAERRALARRDWLSDLGQDLRFAVRAAARSPLFTGMAIITLALGIGANSAVFGVVKSVLLDALPYEDASRLALVQKRIDTSPDLSDALSAGTITDIRERQRSFASLAASISGGSEAVLQQESGAVSLRAVWVEPQFFNTLGVAPALGRSFDANDALSDTAYVTILSHDIWSTRFAGDRAILGQSVVLNGVPRQVVGVLPEGYVHPVAHADLFLPLDMEPLLLNPVNARGSHFIELIGRLRPGVSMDAADAEITTIGAQLAAEYPRDNRGISLHARPLHDAMMGDTRTPLLVLMGSAALVLLIACANLAAALLSRTLSRRREFAVRISLGAARGRLVRQLLAESVLLAAVGGAVGLVIAQTGLALLRNANLEALPDYASLSLDAGAVAFTFVLALITGAVFGLTPALTAGREEPQSVLRDESRGASQGRGAGRLRGSLVAAQVALCLSLLAGAGLLSRSLWLMASAPLGFEVDDALTFNVPLSGPRYATTESHVLFRDEMRQRLAALPGVTDVTVTNFLPTRVYNSNSVVVVGREPTDEAIPFALTTGVLDGYFETLGVPVVAGRTFTTTDRLDSPPVAVVSEAMARRFWPDGDVIGSRIRVGPNPEATPIEVVGIVGDVRTDLASVEAEPMLYMALRQGWWGSTFIVRTAGAPLRLADEVRRELTAYDPALPMADASTLSAVLGDGLAARRLPMLLMLFFGGLALLLACIGIYALFANMAVSREREFGVRMALGSSRRDVAALVLREGAFWMGIGLAGGAVGVFVVSRALSSLVFGIAPLDAMSIAAAVATLLIAATVALAVPVHRATRADPLTVMR